MPPWYRNGEYSLVRQIRTAMTTSPAAPAPSSSRRLRLAGLGRHAPARPGERQGRSDQERERAGVSAVVDAGRIVAGPVQRDHGGHRCGGEHERPGGQPAPACLVAQAPGQEQAEQDQPRPDQVELLLHRQRPQVPERRRCREPGKVRGVLRDQPPVADVARCRGHRAAQRRELRPLQQGDPGGDNGQHDEQRGQEPARAALPEAEEPQPAGRGLLGQQQVGDEVAAQGEEDADAEQAALSPAEADVVGDDGQDR